MTENIKSKTDEYKDRWFAETRWHVDDVISAAERRGVVLTREQAGQWWKRHERQFSEQVTEFGNETLSYVSWDEIEFCSKCGRMIEDEDFDVHNYGTDRQCIVCQDCHDEMIDRNQIIQCEKCAFWYENNLLKADHEPIGGDTFVACPNCGRDIVDGKTREERIEEAQPEEESKIPQYAVTFHYSLDSNDATYLFVDEEEAKKFLRDNYELRVKEAEENNHLVSFSITEDGKHAKVVDFYPDCEDVTEIFISLIYR